MLPFTRFNYHMDYINIKQSMIKAILELFLLNKVWSFLLMTIGYSMVVQLYKSWNGVLFETL